MIRILLPVDDSAGSRNAVDAFLRQLDWYREIPEMHVLNVQPPLRGDITNFLKAELIEQYHRDEGQKAIKPIRSAVEAAGVKAEFHVMVGHAAETICRFSAERDCHQIVMGAGLVGSVGGWILGSTVTRVLRQSTSPVLVMR